MLTDNLKRKILHIQRGEITEYYVYKLLSKFAKDNKNTDILKKISSEELAHYDFWKRLTGYNVKPYKVKLFLYLVIVRIFGLTFTLKLMERIENKTRVYYSSLSHLDDRINAIIYDEDNHENKLIELINEEHLKYMGSVVLGLSDALVELTGALAGFTFALQNSYLVAVVGAITGIAASISMAGSEYLSISEDSVQKKALYGAIYTGFAYITVVLILIAPYVIFNNILLALGTMFINAIFIVFIFSFYLSVVKNIPFKSKFLKMASLCFGISMVSFVIGMLIRILFGIER